MSDRRYLVDTIVRGISLTRLPAIMRRFRPDEFCILMLHGLTAHRTHQGIGNTEDIHIHVDDFREICNLLARHYRVISLDEAVDRLARREPCPRGAVILTFDDGYRSNYELAYPILKQYGLPGTIFVATDFVENGCWQWWDRLEYALGHTGRQAIDITFGGGQFRHPLRNNEERRNAFLHLLPFVKRLPQETVRQCVGMIEENLGLTLDTCPSPPSIYLPATWDHLREMRASSFVSIGAHTHTHRILGRCTEETVRWELSTCRELLDQRLGVTSPLFSYPNGHVGDHTDSTKAIVKELGFRCAVTTETGFNRIDADPFTLRRFSTGNDRHYVDVTASGTMKMLLALNNAVRLRRPPPQPGGAVLKPLSLKP